MTPFQLQERPLPGSLWLTDDYGCGTTVLDLSLSDTLRLALAELEGPFTFTDVLLNGMPLKFRVMGPLTIAVSPRVPREGDRLDILGVHSGAASKAATGSPKALMAQPRHCPSSALTYGLQAPQIPKQRHTP